MIQSLWQATFIGPKSSIDTLSNLLDSEAIASFELDQKNDVWRLQAIYEDAPTRESLEQLIHDLQLNQDSLELSIEELPPVDWLAENRKSFPPLELGSFYIYGSHHENQPLPMNKICLHIDAATAFGTGQHATTQGCLALLEKLPKQAFTTGLDVGCGTGILAMAGARLLQIPFVALDIDDDAVQMADENIKRNALEKNVQVILSDGVSNACVLKHAPYSLIFANILAEPLIHLAKSIVEKASVNGFIILSGLMTHQEQDVLEAYLKEGCKKLDDYIQGDWCSLLLKRID